MAGRDAVVVNCGCHESVVGNSDCDGSCGVVGNPGVEKCVIGDGVSVAPLWWNGELLRVCKLIQKWYGRLKCGLCSCATTVDHRE